MGVAPEVIDGAFRISLSRETTAGELDTLLEVLQKDVLPRARH